MIFNPIIYIVLAGIALVAGIAAADNTGNLIVMIPFLLFILLFGFSLLRKVKS